MPVYSVCVSVLVRICLSLPQPLSLAVAPCHYESDCQCAGTPSMRVRTPCHVFLPDDVSEQFVFVCINCTKEQCPADARPLPTVKALLKAQRASLRGTLTFEAWGVHQAARPTRTRPTRHPLISGFKMMCVISVGACVCLCVYVFVDFVTSGSQTPIKLPQPSYRAASPRPSSYLRAAPELCV